MTQRRQQVARQDERVLTPDARGIVVRRAACTSRVLFHLCQQADALAGQVVREARRRKAADRRDIAFTLIPMVLLVYALEVGLGYALDHPVNARRQEMRIQK